MDPWKTTERQCPEHQMHAGFRAFGCCLFVICIYFFNVKTDMTVAVTQALQSCLLRRYCPPAEYLHKLLQSGRGSVHPERTGENRMEKWKEIKPHISCTQFKKQVFYRLITWCRQKPLTQDKLGLMRRALKIRGIHFPFRVVECANEH